MRRALPALLFRATCADLSRAYFGRNSRGVSQDHTSQPHKRTERNKFTAFRSPSKPLNERKTNLATCYVRALLHGKPAHFRTSWTQVAWSTWHWSRLNRYAQTMLISCPNPNPSPHQKTVSSSFCEEFDRCVRFFYPSSVRFDLA